MSNSSSDDKQTLQTTTGTDMLVSLLANSEKLKPKGELCHYEKQNDDNNEQETLESCMDKEYSSSEDYEQEEHNNQENQNIQDTRNQYEQQPQQQPQPEATLGNQLKLTTVEDVDEYDAAKPEAKKLLKLDMIRKLSELVKKGVKLSANYNMDSDYKTMKYEYELHQSIRRKHHVVSFLQDGCVAGVGMLERANRKFDYFGLQLDGWSDDVSSRTDRLYDAFGEIYEKYSGNGRSIPPELMILGVLGFSAATTHIANSTANSIPSLEDKQREDPHYLEKIRQQALSDTISERKNNQNAVYTDKLAKKYNDAIAQATDYQMLRNYEEEHKRTQQTMQRPNQQQPTMKPPQQPVMRPPQQPTMIPPQMFHSQTVFPTSNMTPEQFTNFRHSEILEHQQQMEKALNRDNKSRDSQSSHVHVNPDIDSIIKEADELSTMSKERKRNGKPRKNNNSIKLNI